MPGERVAEETNWIANFRSAGFKRFLFFSVLLGFLAAASWPLNPFASPPLSVIRIEATGVSDPAGRSAEVWIAQLPESLAPGCLLRGASGADKSSDKPGWEKRDSMLVSHTNQPAAIQCIAPVSADDTIEFIRSPWSGGAVVTINGQSRKLHLYSSTGDKLVLHMNEFPAGVPGPFGILRSLVKFTAAAVLLAIAFILAGLLLERLVLHAKPDSASSGIVKLASLSLPALLVFSVVLAGTWPAQMSVDSAVNWKSLNEMRFDNSQPTLPNLLIGLPGLLLGSIGFAMVIQIALLACSIGCLALEISKWKNGKIAAWSTALITPLFPSVALLTTIYWKDIPYTAFLAILTAVFMAALRTGGKTLRDWHTLALAALLLFLVAACRHNGLIASITMMGALLWLFRRELGKSGIAALVVGGLVAPLLWNSVLLPSTGHVVPVQKYFGGLHAMHLLGAMVAEDNPLSQKTIQKMDSILPLAEWKTSYDCENINDLFHRNDVNREILGRDLIPHAFGAAFEFPATALRHFTCMNSLNWKLSPSRNSIYVPFGVHPELFANAPQFSVRASPVVSIHTVLQSLYRWSSTEILATVVFWRPAAIQLVLLFLAGALVLLKGNRTAPLVLIPLVANTLSLVPLIATQDFRYQYPMCFIGIPLVIYLLAQFIGQKPNSVIVTDSPGDRQVKIS